MVWFWFLGLVLLQSASMFVLMPAPVGFSGTFSAVFSSTILIIFFSFSGKDFLLSCNYEHPLVLDRDGGEALGLLGGGGVLVNDGRLLTPFVSDSDDLLVEGWGLLIRFLQFLCCILGLSGWVGAHVLLLLVPGDETVDGGDDGGGVSSGFFNLWANFSLFSGFSGRLDTPVSGLEVLVRLHAPEELCCGAEALTLTLGCRAGGGETACGGRGGERL